MKTIKIEEVFKEGETFSEAINNQREGADSTHSFSPFSHRWDGNCSSPLSYGDWA